MLFVFIQFTIKIYILFVKFGILFVLYILEITINNLCDSLSRHAFSNLCYHYS
nr:MAG TPA: hypothetical protein [Podoviridae sp. ctY3D12]